MDIFTLCVLRGLFDTQTMFAELKKIHFVQMAWDLVGGKNWNDILMLLLVWKKQSHLWSLGSLETPGYKM